MKGYCKLYNVKLLHTITNYYSVYRVITEIYFSLIQLIKIYHIVDIDTLN